MIKFNLMNLVAILTLLGYAETAFASQKKPASPEMKEESSHAKKAGKALGKAAKNVERFYKETIVEPSKDLRKGVKEGMKSEKGKE